MKGSGDAQFVALQGSRNGREPAGDRDGPTGVALPVIILTAVWW
ncbi:hypothetical protein ACLBOM_35840 [Escherichia coli]